MVSSDGEQTDAPPLYVASENQNRGYFFSKLFMAEAAFVTT
jgi:hypothetical protein